MNRSEVVRAVVWLDQVAEMAKVRSKEFRDQLAADARAEYAEQGTASTWRMPDLATVVMSVSSERTEVTNDVAFLDWVCARYPDKVETVSRVHVGWMERFLKEARIHVDGERMYATDPETGEIVPGVSVRPGGVPLGVSVRVTAAAKEVFSKLATHGLQRLALEAGPAVPTVLAEVSDGGS